VTKFQDKTSKIISAREHLPLSPERICRPCRHAKNNDSITSDRHIPNNYMTQVTGSWKNDFKIVRPFVTTRDDICTKVKFLKQFILLIISLTL